MSHTRRPRYDGSCSTRGSSPDSRAGSRRESTRVDSAQHGTRFSFAGHGGTRPRSQWAAMPGGWAERCRWAEAKHPGFAAPALREGENSAAAPSMPLSRGHAGLDVMDVIYCSWMGGHCTKYGVAIANSMSQHDGSAPAVRPQSRTAALAHWTWSLARGSCDAIPGCLHHVREPWNV